MGSTGRAKPPAWIRVEAGPDTGEIAGFVCVLRADVSAAGRAALVPEMPKDALHALLAPHVIGWNLADVDPVTGASTPFPPPAEAGPDAFLDAPAEVALWIRHHLIAAPVTAAEAARHGDRPGALAVRSTESGGIEARWEAPPAEPSDLSPPTRLRRKHGKGARKR